MAAKSPRIHTGLEPPLFEAIEKLARNDGVSLSQKARDLLRDAVEFLEDAALAEVADERRRTFNPRRALTPTELRRKMGLK